MLPLLFGQLFGQFDQIYSIYTSIHGTTSLKGYPGVHLHVYWYMYSRTPRLLDPPFTPFHMPSICCGTQQQRIGKMVIDQRHSREERPRKHKPIVMARRQ